MIDKITPDGYDEVAIEEPLREMGESGASEFKSLSEAEDDGSMLSDFQSAQRRLFPDFGDPLLNWAGVSRIGEDIFMDKLYLYTIRDIFKHGEDEDIDVIESLSKSYLALAIGLGGKGREDDIVMAGSARESEELKKMSNFLAG